MTHPPELNKWKKADGWESFGHCFQLFARCDHEVQQFQE